MGANPTSAEESAGAQPEALAGRVDLGEALAKKWIEFWYQPKIDLHKKQLVGVEAFAREVRALSSTDRESKPPL